MAACSTGCAVGSNQAMAVIGIGTNSRASAGDVTAIMAAAKARLAGFACHIEALAALDRPDIGSAIQEAARQTGLELVLLPLDELRKAAHLCVTHSERSMRQYGIPSVAEAAALAAAGPGARLLLLRISGRNTTASVAAAP